MFTLRHLDRQELVNVHCLKDSFYGTLNFLVLIKKDTVYAVFDCLLFASWFFCSLCKAYNIKILLERKVVTLAYKTNLVLSKLLSKIFFICVRH